jgi:CheY-like chemotaxis protein
VGRGTIFRVFLPEIYTDSGTPLPVVLGTAADLLRPALPVAPVALTAKSAPLMSPKQLSATAAPICILVVDDEAMVATTTVRLLNKNGFAAISVSGGVEALQVLRERRQEIGLVLTDFMMPDMDGPTLLPLLRQIVPNLKVIGVSGHDKRASGLELGFDAILTKPYDLPAMLATIRRVIAQA